MAGLVATPTRHRPQFHRLTVADIDRITDDAVAVSFAIPGSLAQRFIFAPGQYLTLRATIDGEDVRRSYSICCSPRSAAQRQQLRVAAARVDGGVMSNWLNDCLRVGDEVDVMEPMGTFVTPPSRQPARHHAAIAAGSGITPVLSLLTSALEDSDEATATLILGNRRTDSIMFRDELGVLQNSHPQRFRLIHVLSREVSDAEVLSGRLDRERIRCIIEQFVPASTVDEWYLCGPFGMVEAAQEVLAEFGVDPRHVHQEIFYLDGPAARSRATRVIEEGASSEAAVTIDLER